MKIDVEKLAREAGLWSDLYSHWTCSEQQIQHFARLLMEECVRACQETPVLSIPHTHNWTSLKVQEALIEAIRARMPS